MTITQNTKTMTAATAEAEVGNLIANDADAARILDAILADPEWLIFLPTAVDDGATDAQVNDFDGFPGGFEEFADWQDRCLAEP